jgi:hypothetical protein
MDHPSKLSSLLTPPAFKVTLADTICADAEKQIVHVIHLLAEGSPAEQQHALNTYFLSDASFTHPLCRVPSFAGVALPVVGEVDSRWVIWMIYRWYKILSPRIELTVECHGSFPSFGPE